MRSLFKIVLLTFFILVSGCTDKPEDFGLSVQKLAAISDATKGHIETVKGMCRPTFYIILSEKSTKQNRDDCNGKDSDYSTIYDVEDEAIHDFFVNALAIQKDLRKNGTLPSNCYIGYHSWTHNSAWADIVHTEVGCVNKEGKKAYFHVHEIGD